MFQKIKKNSHIVKINTGFSLGLKNIFYFLIYKISLKFKKDSSNSTQFGNDFFHNPKNTSNLKPSGLWTKRVLYFGFHDFFLKTYTPNWHENPFLKTSSDKKKYSWNKIPDFDPNIGDIKTVWEASRFDWVLSFAQEAKAGNVDYVDRLNQWIKHWLDNNTLYCGINWKCGQEASIRVMHLSMACLILEQTDSTSQDLLKLVEAHLERVAPTIHYAVAQSNNHGTSEAAALFIGGSWLVKNNYKIKKAKRWQSMGVKWLEDRSKKLIETDGSFSQYSVNYHRLMLDTFSMVERWRRQVGKAPFSENWYSRAKLATNWLRSLVNEKNGYAPNIGSNDGARLLPLVNSDYLDYRPSVQLASALFFNKRSYAQHENSDLTLKWLQIPIPSELMEPKKEFYLYDKGGYTILNKSRAMAVMRYPRFRYRPGQSDLLHLDLWIDGENILRDAGTYSYNTDPNWMSYFPSTKAHNTIEFDGRDQMPKIGRFLYGAWLKTNKFKKITKSDGKFEFGVGYKDIYGASHYREIQMDNDSLTVRDFVKGFENKAIIRFRLTPDWSWRVEGNSVVSSQMKIMIHSNIDIQRFEIVEGWESRYYLHKTSLSVLEIEIKEPGEIESQIIWS